MCFSMVIVYFLFFSMLISCITREHSWSVRVTFSHLGVQSHLYTLLSRDMRIEPN